LTLIDPRSVPAWNLRFSCSLSFVELQQSAESFVAADATDASGRVGRGEWNDVAEALVVALGMVVRDKLLDGVPEMTHAERNDVPQTLLPAEIASS
jgi:hypothetical protein